MTIYTVTVDGIEVFPTSVNFNLDLEDAPSRADFIIPSVNPSLTGDKQVFIFRDGIKVWSGYIEALSYAQNPPSTKVTCLSDLVLYQKHINKRYSLEGDPSDLVKLNCWNFSVVDKTTVSYSSTGSSASAGGDNNYDSYDSFGAQVVGDYFQAYLGSTPKNVIAVGMINGSSTYVKNYKVQTSSNGTTWTDRVTVSSEALSSRTLVFSSPVSCNYVRVYCTANDPQHWDLIEFEVYTADTTTRITPYDSAMPNYGASVIIRCNYNPKLKTLNELKELTNWFLYIDPSDQTLYFKPSKGSDKSSLIQFEDGVNCRAASYDEDHLEKVDNLYVLGRGEGRNQLVGVYPNPPIAGGTCRVESYRDAVDLATLNRYAQLRHSYINSAVKRVSLSVLDHGMSYTTGDIVRVKTIRTETSTYQLDTNFMVLAISYSYSSGSEEVKVQLSTRKESLTHLISQLQQAALNEGFEQGSLQTYQVSVADNIERTSAGAYYPISVALFIPPTIKTLEKVELSLTRSDYVSPVGSATGIVATGITASKSLSGVTASTSTTGITASSSLTGITASRVLSGVTASSSVTGVTASRVVSGVTASRALSGVTASTSTTGVTASRALSGVTASRAVSGVTASRVPSAVTASSHAAEYSVAVCSYTSVTLVNAGTDYNVYTDFIPSGFNVSVIFYILVQSRTAGNYSYRFRVFDGVTYSSVNNLTIPDQYTTGLVAVGWRGVSSGQNITVLASNATSNNLEIRCWVVNTRTYAHSHAINEPNAGAGHDTAINEPNSGAGHNTTLNEPNSGTGHNTTLNDPGHGTTLNEPNSGTGHNTTLNEPNSGTGHNTPLNDPGHGTTLNEPNAGTGHNTPINDPGHSTSINDPGHDTVLNEPNAGTGHSTTLNDPAHGHSLSGGIGTMANTVTNVEFLLDGTLKGTYDGSGPYDITQHFSTGRTYTCSFRPANTSERGFLSAAITIRGYAIRRGEER